MVRIIIETIQITVMIFFSMHLNLNAQSNINKAKRPNIIFILTDDQRWDALGYTGNNIIHMTNMDKLAKER